MNALNFLSLQSIMWASTREHQFSGFANETRADQPSHQCSLISAFLSADGKYHAIQTCYERNFNFLATCSLCICSGGFESHFVGNTEDRFPHAAAQLSKLASWEFPLFYLVSIVEQTGLSFTWSETLTRST